MTVAILALQGAFAEHGQMLDKLGADHFEIRQKKDLEKEATIDIIEPIETKELNQNPNETKVDNEEKKD